MVLHEFVPRFRYLTAITNAQYAVATFSEDHDYSDGEIVSFRVSKPFGMTEINNKQTRVISHTSNTITTEIDTSSWTPFVYPVVGQVTPPVVVPAGSGIIPTLYPSTINLEDVFDNRRVT